MVNTAMLAKPVTPTIEFALLPHSQPRTIDLKLEHTKAGLDQRDIQFLDAPPIMVRSQGLTFRGVSIE